MFEKAKSEIHAVKQHLLHSLPAALGLSSDSIVIKAAISGLNKELSRLPPIWCPFYEHDWAGSCWANAVIKEAPHDSLNEVGDTKLKEIGLSKFDSKWLSKEYSGGLKRKHSVARATLGSHR